MRAGGHLGQYKGDGGECVCAGHVFTRKERANSCSQHEGGEVREVVGWKREGVDKRDCDCGWGSSAGSD